MNILKFKKLLFFFYIALSASVLMRLVQLNFTIEQKTGFFTAENSHFGIYLLLLIVAACASTAILCFTTHRSPEHPPKRSVSVGVAAFFSAALTAAEVFFETFAGTVPDWQATVLTLAGAATVVFFVAYGVSLISDFALPPLATAVPVIYFIARIICVFTSISSLALISDNLLTIAAYCALLLFFLFFGKLYNGIDPDFNFRKLLSAGLSSVLLCFTQGLSHILFNIMIGGGYNHTGLLSNAALLVYGLFASAFLYSCFSVKGSGEAE